MSDPVTITPYDPEWPGMFNRLGQMLRDALGDLALRIDHIGSTSIPGLAAKPIIDVQISVASFEPLNAYRIPLEGLGFVFRSANPELTKRYFREKPGERRTHIHVRQLGSFSQQFPLLFRDYMRIHPEEVKSYAEQKYKLADKHTNDRVGYAEAKDPFIWQIVAKADKWAQEIGWQPGPSDA
jgi:GrpB-like predicted nucleotidyltransferase (UPF0157 family)